MVRQQVGAGQAVSFSRQEQGEDADEGGQAGHVVGVVAASLPAHQPGLRQLVAAREAGEDAQCLPLLAAQRGRLGRGRPGVESGEDVFLTQQLEQNIFNIKLYIIYTIYIYIIEYYRRPPDSQLTSALPSSNMWILNLSVVSHV